MKPRSNVLGTAVVGLIGAIIGSFSMMIYASTHFAGIAGPGNTPPAVSAASLPASAGTTDQDRIVNAVRRVQPSVVALEVVVNGTRVVPVDPISQFFNGGADGSGPVVRQHVRERASGSGFVYSRDGLILTNAHVVPRGTSQITVVFNNGDKVKGHVYASNPAVDLALVKVDNYAKLPPPVEFADGSRVLAGQWAIAIGEPLELQHSVAVGVVSGFNRDEPIQAEDGTEHLFKGLLQTSAPINPGNSGGPLIDVEGRLIGVNQSTANPQAGAQGIGFAIPASTVREQVAELEKNPGTHQGTNTGFIGAGLVTVTPQIGVQINYKGAGVAIEQVVQGGPADQAGLQPGDVIQKINGADVTKTEEVIKAIRATKPGGNVNLEVWSAGVKKLVTVKVQERPADVGALLPQQQQQQQGQDPTSP